MTLYAKYILEREGKYILEEEHGFLTYSFLHDGIYAEDIFIASEARRSGLASALADRLAVIGRENGFKFMYGSVVPSANNSTASLKVLLAYGFKLDSCAANFILMKKEI